MDVLAAYREVGSYRGAAEMCGTTHKTVKRIVERHNAGGAGPERKDRGHNYDDVEKWMPQFDAAYAAVMAREPPHLHAPPQSLAGLPIVEVPPTGTGIDRPAIGDTFAVLFSGDGGFYLFVSEGALLDQGLVGVGGHADATAHFSVHLHGDFDLFFFGQLGFVLRPRCAQ